MPWQLLAQNTPAHRDGVARALLMAPDSMISAGWLLRVSSVTLMSHKPRGHCAITEATTQLGPEQWTHSLQCYLWVH